MWKTTRSFLDLSNSNFLQGNFPLIEKNFPRKTNQPPYDDNEMESRYLKFLAINEQNSILSNDYETSEYSSDDYEYSKDEISALRSRIDRILEENSNEDSQKSQQNQVHSQFSTIQNSREQIKRKVLKEKQFCHKEYNEDLSDASKSFDSKFACKICQFSSPSSYELIVHSALKHNINVNKIKLIQTALNGCQHQVVNKNALEPRLKISKKRDQTLEKTFTCKICPNRRYVRALSLKKHYEKNHHTSKSCKQFIAEYNRMEDEALGKTWLCTACDERFHCFRSLEKHISVHDSSKQFQCQVCLYRFSTNKLLEAHFETSHSKTKFSCCVCKKRFNSEKALLEHERRNSDKIRRSKIRSNHPIFTSWLDYSKDVLKNFACGICWMNFCNSTEQMNHFKSHFKSKRNIEKYKHYFDPTVEISRAESLAISKAGKSEN